MRHQPNMWGDVMVYYEYGWGPDDIAAKKQGYIKASAPRFSYESLLILDRGLLNKQLARYLQEDTPQSKACLRSETYRGKISRFAYDEFARRIGEGYFSAYEWESAGGFTSVGTSKWRTSPNDRAILFIPRKQFDEWSSSLGFRVIGFTKSQIPKLPKPRQLYAIQGS